MQNQNISFVNGEHRFNFRVGVIIEYGDLVLLETSGSFWNMIGGRVQLGESTVDCAKRELKEELNLEVKNINLVNISENFFNWNGLFQQELLFVYKTTLPLDCDIIKKQEFKCLDANKTFKWHKKIDIKKLDCRPDTIKTIVMQECGITHKILN